MGTYGQHGGPGANPADNEAAVLANGATAAARGTSLEAQAAAMAAAGGGTVLVAPGETQLATESYTLPSGVTLREQVPGSVTILASDGETDVTDQYIRALPPRNYARQTEAGRTVKIGPGKVSYGAWAAIVDGTRRLFIERDVSFSGADDDPGDTDYRVTSIVLRPSSTVTALYACTVYQSGTNWVIRDIVDVSANIAADFVTCDLTGHTGGGLAIRPGDCIGAVALSTGGTNALGVGTDTAVIVTGGDGIDFVNVAAVPTAGATYAASGMTNLARNLIFEATIAGVPGCLWTITGVESADAVPLPRWTDTGQRMYVAIRDIIVPNAQTVEIALLKNAAAGGVLEADYTLTLDMGAADQMTQVAAAGGGAVNVALNTAFAGTCTGGTFADGATPLTFNTGTAYDWFAQGTRYIQIAGVGTFAIAAYTDATHITVTGDASTASGAAWTLSEANDHIDVLLSIDVAGKKINALWQNKRTGQAGAANHNTITTRSFANAAASAYGSLTAAANLDKMAGIKITAGEGATFSGSIEVGIQPLVAGVSSWGALKATSIVKTTPNHVVSELISLLSPSRIVWLCGIYGGRFYRASTKDGLRVRWGASDAAGNSNDPTAGIHDYREIVQAVALIEGLPNDLTAITAAGGTRPYVRKIALDIGSWLDTCLQSDQAAVVVGTLPRGYLAGATIDALIGTNSEARRILNGMTRNLCERYGAAYVDPTVEGVTQNTWNTPYEKLDNESTTSRGHLTTAGDQWLAGLIAKAINSMPYDQTPYEVA